MDYPLRAALGRCTTPERNLRGVSGWSGCATLSAQRRHRWQLQEPIAYCGYHEYRFPHHLASFERNLFQAVRRRCLHSRKTGDCDARRRLNSTKIVSNRDERLRRLDIDSVLVRHEPSPFALGRFSRQPYVLRQGARQFLEPRVLAESDGELALQLLIAVDRLPSSID